MWCFFTFFFFFSHWTSRCIGNALIESLFLHLERKLISAWGFVSYDWVIHFTLSIPIQPQCISCTVHVWGGKEWRNWGRNESRSFEVLFSRQAKQQAYSYPPEQWKSLAFDWCSVATLSVFVLQICMCYLCHVGYPAWSHITLGFGLWRHKQELLGHIFLSHQTDMFWTKCWDGQLPAEGEFGFTTTWVLFL